MLSRAEHEVVRRVLDVADPRSDVAFATDEELAEARKVVDRIRRYTEIAFGELLIKMPEPGTDMAKLLGSNIVIRNQRDDYQRQYRAERDAHTKSNQDSCAAIGRWKERAEELEKELAKAKEERDTWQKKYEELRRMCDVLSTHGAAT